MSAHSMSNKELWEWQQRLRAQPLVWTVYIQGESTGNVYESKEAAEREVAWFKRHRPRERASVGALGNVHSDALSRERWDDV